MKRSAKRSLGMNWPGTFAELVAVPAEFAHPLPDDIPFEDADGIEPLAVALHAANLGDSREGDYAAAQPGGRVVALELGTGDARHALAGLESVPATLQTIAAAEDDGNITIALEGATP